MTAWLQDVRYALRQLAKTPGFAVTAVLSLALGIGATTAVFSVVYAVLIDPYPYPNSERMIHPVLSDKQNAPQWVQFNGPQFQQIRDLNIIETAAAQDQWNLSTTGGDLPEDVTAVSFSGSAFNHFGVPMLLGRPIIPADAPDGQGPQPVAVLGYGFWQRHYYASHDVLGKTIQLDRKNYTIVGVAPPRFTWGDGDVYLPLKMTSDPERALSVSLRLKPGITHQQANAQLEPLIKQFAKETPDHFPPEFHVAVQGLNDQFIERIGGTLYLLLGAVVMLLAIGCGNVSILLLARGTVRQQELAVRAAVGASRARLIQQLLTEALLLAFTGAALGILVAYQIVALIVRWLPEFSFPHEAAIEINLPVLLFSVAIAITTAVLFGLSPAVQFSRPELAHVMQSSSRRTTTGIQGKRTHHALIAGQIAITLLLLVSAGAATRSFLKLMHADLGYDSNNTMAVGLPIHENTLKTWQERAAYYEQIRQKISATPGVISTVVSTNAVPPNSGWENIFKVQGTPAVEERKTRINFVGYDYFEVLHIPLLHGRLWDQNETARGARVAVINQSMARKYWPDGDAIGKQVQLPTFRAVPPYFVGTMDAEKGIEIIGIVADARNDGLREKIKPGLYMPYTYAMGMFTQFLVKAQVPPKTLLNPIREQIRSVNADQQAVRIVRSLDEWITTQPEYQQEHLITSLFAGFAALALAMAAVGLYSVVSYTVAQRTNEIGIRMALGALRGHILQVVFSSALVSVGIGLLAGVLLSIVLDGILVKWALVRSRDPLVLVAVSLVLVVSAGIACLVPARRAVSVEPMEALRCE
jgi:putative ABC transport system permease protein